MEKETTMTIAWRYLRNNWFKAGVVLLLVFIVLKKDLSFNVRLNTTNGQEPAAPVEPARKAEKRSTERLTEAQPVRSAASTGSTDLLNLTSILGARKPKAEDALYAVSEEAVQAYIRRFKKVARAEARKYGIPAEVILGNALLLSTAGQYDAAEKGNNHFRLPCSGDWVGHSGYYDNLCLRHYENAWTSFRDHSLYLTTGDLGRKINEYHPVHISDWAMALEKAGFSSEKDFGEQLIGVIEKYRLAD